MKGHIRERSPGHFAIVLETREFRDRQASAQVAQLHRDKTPGPD